MKRIQNNRLYLKYQDNIQDETNYVFNHLKDSIALISYDFKIKKTNKAFNKLFNFDKRNRSRNFLSYLDDSYGEKLKKLIIEKCGEDHIEDMDISILSDMGKKLFLNLSISIIQEHSEILITLKDVSSIKRYEEVIKEHQKLIDDNIITSRTDIRGIITYVSKAFCDISEYSKDELIGNTHTIVRHPEMDSVVYKKMWQSLLLNKTWKGELKNISKSGKTYWVDATISPIFINNKKVGYSSIRQNITDKKKLQELAITDELTEIYNRRFFNEKLKDVLNTSKRRRENIALMIIDIDFFKQYNDTHGHQEGDFVLKRIADILSKFTRRADDYCFRIGGEEFAVLFNPITKDEAFNFANIIKEAVIQDKMIHRGIKTNKPSYITVSIGVFCNNANNIDTIDFLFKKADDLLYLAKNNGRNRVEAN